MKRFLKFIIRSTGILLLLLILLYGIFYVYWTIKGERDLKAARAELIALGEPMDASEIIPKPVPMKTMQRLF